MEVEVEVEVEVVMVMIDRLALCNSVQLVSTFPGFCGAHAAAALHAAMR